MIYVMSDLHGRLDMFKEMLKKIHFTQEDMLYVIGDVVDRGSEPLALLEIIKNTENILMLRGNHEEMMLEYYTKGLEERWFLNGGNITRKQMVGYGVEWARVMLTWVSRLKYTHEIKLNGQVYRLVHAGLIYTDGKVDRKQDSMYMTWARKEFYEKMNVGSDIVIFGHTPTNHFNKDHSYKIWKKDNKICIDCGAAYGGKLACLCLDTMEEYYIDN